jgi:putative Ca2+/H+ antiporter (TMEM165/GDT1 family)
LNPLSIFLISAGTVALAEMGDKTQLLALSLQARYDRPWVILAGVLLATMVNHGISASLGGWVSTAVPAKILNLGLAISFIAFGFWTLLPDKEDAAQRHGQSAFWTTLVLFFLAEMGDKTQLATLALGARFPHPGLVTLGTTTGMLFSDGLAIFLGAKAIRFLGPVRLRRAAAASFFIFGVFSAWKFLVS